jgi:hypothetical protein
MTSPAEIGLERWHEFVESHDATRLPGLIAEGAVFRSPALDTPQEGRELVTASLAGAITVLGPTLTYLDEWVRERDAVLRFTAEVDGVQVEGIDIVGWDDDGHIVEFTVMLRPFKALQAVMTRRLEQPTR